MTAPESNEARTNIESKNRMTALRQWFGALARWQKVCLAVASLFLFLGLVASVVEGSSSPSGSGQDGQSLESAEGAGGPSSLLPGSGQHGNPGAGGQKSSQEGTGTSPWSAGFFRLGFSFFAGFSIGMALRSFLKLLVVGSGIALLFLFLLSYGELISVNWTAIDSLFENFARRISEESGRFQSFITGSLPSAGLASLGLATALRRGPR